MKTIISTYPGFQSLPKGVKQMLVATESFYYTETNRVALKVDGDKPVAISLAKLSALTDLDQLSRQLATV